jgi:hypothetical protein
MKTDKQIQQKIKKRRKEKTIAATPELVSSLFVAALVTIEFYYQAILVDSAPLGAMSGFGKFGLCAGIFVFTFGFVFSLVNWKLYKNRFEMNKYTWFLILSLILSGAATWLVKGKWISFILGFSCVYMVFYIFWKFDYGKINRSCFQFLKSLAYIIIFPSMFLIIAAMGTIDNKNIFMSKIIPQANWVGDVLSNVLINVIQTIYNLGKYEYSLIFIITTFIFLVFFAIYDFVKKTIADPEIL